MPEPTYTFGVQLSLVIRRLPRASLTPCRSEMENCALIQIIGVVFLISVHIVIGDLRPDFSNE